MVFSFCLTNSFLNRTAPTTGSKQAFGVEQYGARAVMARYCVPQRVGQRGDQEYRTGMCRFVKVCGC